MLDDGEPYMVMELQEGRSLADVIARPAAVRPRSSTSRASCSRVSPAAHQAGTIHLDVSRTDVMAQKVRDHGGDVVVKLWTSASARLTEVEAESEDDERIAVGAPTTMYTPSSCADQRRRPATDLYAAGVLLYEAITRQNSVRRRDHRRLVIAIMGDEIPGADRRCVPSAHRARRVVIEGAVAPTRSSASRTRTTCRVRWPRCASRPARAPRDRPAWSSSASPPAGRLGAGAASDLEHPSATHDRRAHAADGARAREVEATAAAPA